jgi:hypothetical protein
MEFINSQTLRTEFRFWIPDHFGNVETSFVFCFFFLFIFFFFGVGNSIGFVMGASEDGKLFESADDCGVISGWGAG